MSANPRYGNGNRRRRLRAAVLASEDVCGICGQPVDKTLPPLHPGAPTVDEIVPISLGGSPYERGNVRLAHRVCNLRRGNGTRQARVWPPVVTSQEW